MYRYCIGDVLSEWRHGSDSRTGDDILVDTLVLLLEVTRGKSVSTVGIISAPHHHDAVSSQITGM
jgi:hypothetical protein